MQAGHGVATVRLSATKISNVAIYYYCATTLYYAHSLVRDSVPTMMMHYNIL
jgi:hypothetical protein